MKMLGLKTIRNPYLATLAMGLVLLPLLWVPGHSHSIGVYRAHCSACLLTVLSATILSVGAMAILLVRNWREHVAFSRQPVMLPCPSSRGRAPPRSFDR